MSNAGTDAYYWYHRHTQTPQVMHAIIVDVCPPADSWAFEQCCPCLATELSCLPLLDFRTLALFVFLSPKTTEDVIGGCRWAGRQMPVQLTSLLTWENGQLLLPLLVCGLVALFAQACSAGPADSNESARQRRSRAVALQQGEEDEEAHDRCVSDVFHAGQLRHSCMSNVVCNSMMKCGHCSLQFRDPLPEAFACQLLLR